MSRRLEPTFAEFAHEIERALNIELPPGASGATDLVTEIGLDSLQVFELLVVIEDLAGLAATPDDVPSITTLAGAYEYFLAALIRV